MADNTVAMKIAAETGDCAKCLLLLDLNPSLVDADVDVSCAETQWPQTVHGWW
jgi:hypothetical protein